MNDNPIPQQIYQFFGTIYYITQQHNCLNQTKHKIFNYLFMYKNNQKFSGVQSLQQLGQKLTYQHNMIYKRILSSFPVVQSKFLCEAKSFCRSGKQFQLKNKLQQLGAMNINKTMAMITRNNSFNYSTSLKSKFQEKLSSLNNSNNNTQKTYQMPQKIQQKLFKPKRTVSFNQGRALIYYNKQNLLTPNLLPMYIIAPMIYLGYLIKINPFYLTFPAALPIMGLLEILLFFRWGAHKKHNKYQIQRIYLMDDGQVIQIWLANKIRRKLKNTPENIWLNVSVLKSPPDNQNQLPKRGEQFPTDLSNIQKPSIWNYGWSKYDSKYQVYVFPKYYEYANWQLLIPAFNGIKIDTSQCPKTPIPIQQLKRLPTIEQADKEMQMLKIYEAEWQKKNGKLEYTKQEAQKWI